MMDGDDGASFQLDPVDYDCILVGTSLTNTILASALSVAGKSVLHVDRNAHYGGNLTSLRLDPFLRWTEALPGADSEVQGRVACASSVREAWMQKLRECKEIDDAGLGECVFVPLMRTDVLPRRREETDSSPLLLAEEDWTRTLVSEPAFFGGSVYVPAEKSEELQEDGKHDNGGDEWTLALARKRSRAFWLDLNPQLLVSNARILEVLVRSNIYRYMQFRAIDEVAHVFESDEGLALVPMSKAGVFSSGMLSRTEKWAFTRLMHAVLGNARTDAERDELKSGIDSSELESLESYLREQKLSDRLISVLLHCLCFHAPLGSEATSMDTKTGVARLNFVLKSIGKYSPGPFIMPTFGVSEIPQSFARSSAIFRGVQLLKFELESLVVTPRGDQQEPWKAVGVISARGRQVLTAKHFVLDQDYIPLALGSPTTHENNPPRPTNVVVARCMAIVTQSVLPNGVGCGYADVPPGTVLTAQKDEEKRGSTTHENPVHLIQLDNSFDICPRGLFVVFMHTILPIPSSSSSSSTSSCAPATEAQVLLLPVLQYLASKAAASKAARVLCASFYHQRIRNRQIPTGQACVSGIAEDSKSFLFPDNVLLSSDTHCFVPEAFDKCLEQAEKHFSRLYPDEPFLPAPKEVVQERQAEEESGLNIREIRHLQDMDAEMDEIDGLLADLEAEELSV